MSEAPVRWRSRVMARLVPGVMVTREQAMTYAETWARHNELARLEDPRPLWVVLGDSMSQGVGASTFDGAWVNQAATALTAAGHSYRIINLSATGATTREVVDVQLPQLAVLEPSLVTLLAGANDMFRPAMRRGLEARFTKILATLPRCSVVAKLPQPVPLAHRVNALVEAAAAQRGIVAVDLRPAARHWRGHRAEDLFHPNERGYARIADRFVDAIISR
jgi:lysophospholipase L1-like esterase